MIEIRVPSVGESISEVQIGQWLVREGDWVAKDQFILDLETEKAAMQVSAPQAGYVRNFRWQTEQFANVGDILCDLEPAEAPAGTASGTGPGVASTSAEAGNKAMETAADSSRVMPAARRILEEKGLTASQVQGTGPGGRVLKEDALGARPPATTADSGRGTGAPTSAGAVTSTHTGASISGSAQGVQSNLEISAPGKQTNSSLSFPSDGRADRMEEVRPLSMIRRTIANRLVEAQQTAALLTTFNEVNMQPIMELRSKYRDAFQERHGVKLGFMSFFAKASVEALRRFPSVNAEIRGNNVVYRNYMDIGIAIGGGKGLVVPVLRNVEHMAFAEVERTIGQFASKAMENRLMPEDLSGGTFTISNGGVYGSMLSTPIVNPPQSAILGLHAIQERPMAVQGKVVILPMMYLALTYDHRIIDGREAVTFLRTIKEICEDPTRLFLEV